MAVSVRDGGFLLRRTLFLAALIALTLVPRADAAEWLRSVSGAQARAKAKKQMIFVDLFAQWCGWCHKFEADVVPTEEFKKATENMVLLRVDTEDRGDGTALARKFQISTLPTFLILNPDMTVVGTIRGYAPAPQFVKKIGETVNRYESFSKTVKQEATFARNYPKRLEIAREFSQRQAWSETEPRLRKLISEKGVPLGFRDEAYFELAMMYMARGKFDDTVRITTEFAKVQKEGEFFERSSILRGNALLSQGKLADAVEVFRDFKDRFPNSTYIGSVNAVLPQMERQLQTQ